VRADKYPVTSCKPRSEERVYISEFRARFSAASAALAIRSRGFSSNGVGPFGPIPLMCDRDVDRIRALAIEERVRNPESPTENTSRSERPRAGTEPASDGLGGVSVRIGNEQARTGSSVTRTLVATVGPELPIMSENIPPSSRGRKASQT